MDCLPPELKSSIIDFLDPRSKAILIRLNYYYYQLAYKKLYYTLTFYIDPYTGNLSTRSLKLLYQLYSEHKLFQNNHILSNLKLFQWRVGYLNNVEYCPLPIPPCIRSLELSACQIDPKIIFPLLERLVIRRVTDKETSWVHRQVRSSNIKELSISGFSAVQHISILKILRPEEEKLVALESLELEYIHLDSWPLPARICLKELAFRYCSNTGQINQLCGPNVSKLKKFTFVSDVDIENVLGFRKMLSACQELKELVLLLGGRTSVLPLQWLRPVFSNLQTLIIETRRDTILPMVIMDYSLEDLELVIHDCPKLEVLGMPLCISFEMTRYINPIPLAQLRVLHVRNLLAPQSTAQCLERASKYLARALLTLQPSIVLLVGNCHCPRIWKVFNVALSSRRRAPVVEELYGNNYEYVNARWIETL
ncbi:hypothetical protein K469DRAFT_683913 [Zopfia rhizophila CBS 207.26]|uniref:F-box domain-containing protein n=1 Tax=Zopfia rhizophila CBS 207.26 TaxID=1314779 RepID=A0A6A6DC18_9PEZI|nr:hypothetical protein K469DRAFT_683913 [Zopfia rhizophila CBS 207.26]